MATKQSVVRTRTKSTTKSESGGTPGAAGSPSADVLTLAEAAAWLRVTEDGLRRDAEAGRVPGRAVAGEWRFVKATLLEWLSSPQPRSGPARTGAELAEWIRTFNAASPLQETEEEYEAFLENIRAARDATDRATRSGKYAPK